MRVLYIALIAIAVVLSVGIIFNSQTIDQNSNIKKFSSYDELKNFLKTRTEEGYYGGEFAAMGTITSAQKTAESTPSAPTATEDYSRTNIQVAGVDEADIVKNDGKYVYVVSGEKIVIIDAYPAENAKILSEIELNGTAQEIFINKDKLVVFGQESYDYYASKGFSETGLIPPTRYTSKSFIKIYDVSNRQNPILARNFSVEGNYYDSRMIGDYVYVIINQPVYYNEPEPVPLPIIYSGTQAKTTPASEIYYFDIPDSSYIYTNVLSINTQNDAEDVSSKTFLMGYSQNIYVSLNNIYITYSKRLSEYDFLDKIIDEAILPAVPSDIQNKINDIRNSNIDKYQKMEKIGEAVQDYLQSLNPEEAATVMKTIEDKMVDVQKEIAKEIEKTVVHKISISDGKIEYRTNGEVPGNVLNQFSMDEYNEYFRIATTTGEVSRTGESTSLNHLYVLDENLKIVGKIEDLAKGEKIYSARFLGNRAYVVTFRKIDPLFVIDLTAPENPKVLGYLKVTGYSDYLHPYDENHIIGIGKETAGGDENFAWYQGLKISLFDVSDVENPTEIGKVEIGDRGTDSEALRDHKAFLFDKEKNLLVLPVSLAEINETYYENMYNGKVPDWAYGNTVWVGAYVFNIDLTNGIELKGRITHTNETSSNFYDYSSQIKRSLYIDNVLYTISSKMIKMNDLGNLDETNSIDLPYEQAVYPYY